MPHTLSSRHAPNFVYVRSACSMSWEGVPFVVCFCCCFFICFISYLVSEWIVERRETVSIQCAPVPCCVHFVSLSSERMMDHSHLILFVFGSICVYHAFGSRTTLFQKAYCTAREDGRKRKERWSRMIRMLTSLWKILSASIYSRVQNLDCYVSSVLC